ncbi:iron ABC transporter permease [Pseudonocardia kujensis]|uniref:ABC transporter permease n=1 Tax=Pseudonocardia kujensis TaxID=1128675 RepID=UPI001E5EFCAE|nr:iron ABC transporter permease [Pseudonocardia kujensis]MCE0762044.1 iron ABC transporter permease [Pseudonocardia kujensis]
MAQSTLLDAGPAPSGPPPTARRSDLVLPGVTLLTFVVVAVLVLVPLGFLLVKTFTVGGSFSLAAFADTVKYPGFGAALWTTVVFAVLATVIALVTGSVTAFVLVRTDVPGRRALSLVVLVPLILPSVLYAMAWVFLASPRIGLLEHFLGWTALNVYSVGGMALVQGLAMAPLAHLAFAGTFTSMDPSLEEAARVGGASAARTFRRVTLPLARPALLSTTVLCFTLAVEGFEIPILLGLPNKQFTLTTLIYQALGEYPPDYGVAGAISTMLVVALALVILAQNRAMRATRSFQTISAKGHSARRLALGSWRWPVCALTWLYVGVTVVAPLVMLAYASTQSFYRPPSWESLATAGLDSYGAAAGTRDFADAAINSVLLSVVVASALMFLMSVVAWIRVRSGLRLAWVVESIATVPLVVPGLILGVALLTVYVNADIGVYGGLGILVIAYMTRYMPFGVRYAQNAIYQIDDHLEESARVSGASRWQAFVRVLVPLMRPGLVAGWIFIAIVSFRDLSTPVLLYSSDSKVFPVLVFEKWQNGALSEAATMGMMLVLFLLVVGAVAAVPLRRSGGVRL